MTRTHNGLKPEQYQSGVSRRNFLVSTALAGVSAATIIGSAGSTFAAALDEDQAAALLQIVQDIYPHPQFLPVSVYRDVIGGVLDEADTTPETAALLTAGLSDLNARATALYSVNYASVDVYDKREGLLRAIENSDFFQKLRWATWSGIYVNKDLWPRFGYEGSSWEHGGYIDRGFSDATWIPEGPTLEERLKAVGA